MTLPNHSAAAEMLLVGAPRMPLVRRALLALLLVFGFLFVFASRAPAGWVPGHWEQEWIPERTEWQWEDGYWEDRWVPGYNEQYWVDGYWSSQWVDGYWDNQWVDGYWDQRWQDGYWQDQWNDGQWQQQWVDGYWDQRWVDGYWEYDEWSGWYWVDGYWEWYWVDGYWQDVWIDGYWSSVWIDGYWENVWVDGYWNNVWIDGYWQNVWNDGYWDTRWVDGYYESVWVDGQWVAVTIPGYWNSYWVDGYWDPPLDQTWQSFDDVVSGWYAATGWSPDPASYPIGQPFTQTRTMARDHRTGERNDAGEERNVSYYQETTTESRGATGTAKLDQAAVYSSSASERTGVGFSPSIWGGSGSGGYEWCVAGYTNWGTGSWTAPSANSYQFWVRRIGDSTYNDSTPAGPYTLTVYAPVYYTLTVNSGSGSGSYESGESVSIAASSPATGNVFSSWSKSGPGTLADANWHSTQFTMGAGAATVTASYRQVNFNWGAPNSVVSEDPYSVSVSVDSGGMPYVTLRKNGAYFAGGWFGTQGSTSDPAVQTVSFGAEFSDSMKPSSGSSSRSVAIRHPVLTAGVSPAGAGTVSGGGSHPKNSTPTLTASANTGYAFSHWSGDASGSANPVTVSMTGDKSVTANYHYVVATSVSPAGAGSVSGGGSYAPNAVPLSW